MSNIILVKIPTRGRGWEWFWPYLNNHVGQTSTHFLIATDEDDDTTANVPQWVQNNATVVRGKSRSKIHAINRELPGRTPWDVLIVGSDDMVPILKGYDKAILELFAGNLDQAIWIPTEDSSKEMRHGHPMIPGTQKYLQHWISMLPIMGRQYFNRFGYVYHPSYKSFWCDNEYTRIGQKLGKLTFHDRPDIFRHNHPAWGGNTPQDDTYKKANATWQADKHNFQNRQSRGFSI